jgi:flagellar motor switch protein FliG
MTDLDYSKFSRPQKLAVFLIVIGPEAAAGVLRQFDDGEIELLCREMSALRIIPAAAQKQALEEFSPLVAQGAGSSIGGVGYAQRTLEIAKGEQVASAFAGRMGPVGGAVEVVREFAEMEGRQIFNLVKGEQAQTISFLLSYLDLAKSAEVFALLEPELREEVMERLGTIESTSVELVGKVTRSLGRHCGVKTRPARHRSGGVQAVADLLNQLDKEMAKNLLGRLEERNAELSVAIRKKLFNFEGLNRLQPSDLQRVLREVESASLSLSMKAASPQLRGKIYAAMSKRAAESLKEEVELLGSVRLKDVEAAQDAVIQIVRRLEEEGQITLEADSAASVVA